jgi:hypothetical protein
MPESLGSILCGRVRQAWHLARYALIDLGEDPLTNAALTKFLVTILLTSSLTMCLDCQARIPPLAKGSGSYRYQVVGAGGRPVLSGRLFLSDSVLTANRIGQLSGEPTNGCFEVSSRDTAIRGFSEIGPIGTIHWKVANDERVEFYLLTDADASQRVVAKVTALGVEGLLVRHSWMHSDTLLFRAERYGGFALRECLRMLR